MSPFVSLVTVLVGVGVVEGVRRLSNTSRFLSAEEGYAHRRAQMVRYHIKSGLSPADAKTLVDLILKKESAALLKIRKDVYLADLPDDEAQHRGRKG